MDIYGSRRGEEIINEALEGSIGMYINGLVVNSGYKATDNSKVSTNVFQFTTGNWNARNVTIGGGAVIYDIEYNVALSGYATRVVISNHHMGKIGPNVQSGKKQRLVCTFFWLQPIPEDLGSFGGETCIWITRD